MLNWLKYTISHYVVGRIRTLALSLVVHTRMKMVREMGSFDQEGAKIYSFLAEQHRHEKGPWTMILDKVVAHTNGISNERVKILDLASGPGEPAATMARALPKVSIDVLNGS